MRLIGGLILLATAIFVCLAGWDAGFMADDFVMLNRVSTTPWLSLLVTPVDPTTPGFLFYRPVTMLSWKIDYLLFGTDPAGFHLVNCLLFATVVLLAALLVMRMQRNGWIAFITGMVLCLHPTVSGNLAWISFRADLLATAFCLAAALFFLAMPTNQSRGCFNSLGAVICSILAMLSKETALVVPLLIVMCDRMDARKDSFTPTRAPFYTAHFIAFGLILIARYFTLGSVIGSYGVDSPITLISIIGNLRSYFNQVLFPLTVDFTGKPILKLIVFLGMSALLSTAFLFRRLRFSIAFAAIALIPVLHLYRSEYLLLPMVGFACLLANFFQSDSSRDRSMEANLVSGVIVLTLLGAYSMETLHRAQQWHVASDATAELQSVMLTAYPDPEPFTHFLLEGYQPPHQFFPGIFDKSLTKTVCLWYEDQTLSARIASESDRVDEQREGPVQTLIFNNSHLILPLTTGHWIEREEAETSLPATGRIVVIRIE